jgi:hypothetical protein
MHRTLDFSPVGPGRRSSWDGTNAAAAGGAARRPGRRQAGAGIAAFYAADLARGSSMRSRRLWSPVFRRMRCTCVAAVAGEMWRTPAISPSDRTPLRIKLRTSCSLEESLACLAWAFEGIRSVRTWTIDWARPRRFQCRTASTTAQIPTRTASVAWTTASGPSSQLSHWNAKGALG